MMAHRGLATCLTCSKALSPSLLPKCVIHSCCSRPVCPPCLEARPRLATFCPFCEGVDHAFRKGPRSDVTRAGQVLWDTQRMLEEDEGAPSETSSEATRWPPPAYEESGAAPPAPTDFVVGGEEDEEVDENGPSNQRQYSSLEPSLLSSASSKALPSQSSIDRSLSATGSTPGPTLSNSEGSSPLLRTLSNARTKSTSESFSSASIPPSASSLPATTKAQASTEHSERAEADGRTRQYWLRPNDSLQGLSLRFRVPAASLCKLNALPLSTIHSTPHLVHTRPFLLIPEPAIAAALLQRNDETATTSLEEALQGPRPLSAREKTQRVRARSEGRFRALVARSEAPSSVKGKSRAADEIRCDERAARVYVGLVEEELNAVEGIKVDVGDNDDERQDGKATGARVEEVSDAELEERFETIVKLAVSRWEMDSEWERGMRLRGLDPQLASSKMPQWQTSSSSSSSSSSSGGSQWLQRVFGSKSSTRVPREHWQTSSASYRRPVDVGIEKQG